MILKIQNEINTQPKVIPHQNASIDYIYNWMFVLDGF